MEQLYFFEGIFGQIGPLVLWSKGRDKQPVIYSLQIYILYPMKLYSNLITIKVFGGSGHFEETRL